MVLPIDPIDYFKNPKHPKHKQYEALRAYYLESLSQKEAAKRVGYSVYTLQSIISEFQNGKIEFFPIPKPGPRRRQISDYVYDRIVSLRKHNHSAYEIKDVLEHDNIKTSLQTISRILADEGFTKLPRRTKKEIGISKKGTLIPPIASRLNFEELTQYRFECPVGGVFYFIPYILRTNIHGQILDSSFPETTKLSKINSILSILAMKLIGHERLSRIDDYNFDTGFGFFAGLNVPPKNQAISTYSYRVNQQATQTFLEDFILNMNSNFNQFYQGKTINLDFHAIPHYGDKSMMDNNWVGSKHQSLKSALTFFAQDGESKMLIYENADIERKDAPNEIMNFVDYWIRIKGIIDQTLVFDSKLTTYEKLEELDGINIKFITLRRRGKTLIDNAKKIPDDDWHTVDLKKPKRKHNKFKIAESEIVLPRTKLKLRQLIFKDHGREEPTFLITNNFEIPIETLALYYSNRWLIENKISEIVNFFNLNALSSSFMIRIYFDVALTVIADTLYKLLAQDLKRFEDCTPKTIFHDFINCSCKGIIQGNDVKINMKKKKTTPLFKSNELFQRSYQVPWWGNKKCSYNWIA
jgi:transposase